MRLPRLVVHLILVASVVAGAWLGIQAYGLFIGA